jgi:phosphoribosylaminoimidazole (AIR) synthetase
MNAQLSIAPKIEKRLYLTNIEMLSKQQIKTVISQAIGEVTYIKMFSSLTHATENYGHSAIRLLKTTRFQARSHTTGNGALKSQLPGIKNRNEMILIKATKTAFTPSDHPGERHVAPCVE